MKKAIGKTIVKVDVNARENELLFYFQDGSVAKMYHDQDCCESVWLEDTCGDWADLYGSPLLQFDEETNKENVHVSITWTFYKIATVKGTVTLRWCGESNGYYSESVDWEWESLRVPEACGMCTKAAPHKEGCVLTVDGRAASLDKHYPDTCWEWLVGQSIVSYKTKRGFRFETPQGPLVVEESYW